MTIFLLYLFACQNTESNASNNAVTDSGTNLVDDCEQCLQEGNTWQPEANECTTNCEILDISCFTTECPEECSESCNGCFSESECIDAGCTWQMENEAAWCN